MTTDQDPQDALAAAQAVASEAAEELRRRVGDLDLRAAFVMGSGWKDAADAIGAPVQTLQTTELPGFVRPAAAGHTGEVRIVQGSGGAALVFVGRTHLYEGHGAAAAVHGVRTAAAAGCSTVVLTNAAGSLTPDLPVGHPALISDHINFTATSPLVGANFVDLTDVYSEKLRRVVRGADTTIGEGVYGGWFGPAFETPAEIRMMHTLGCDLVGMSTVLEAIAARDLGLEVLGMSLVTNRAAGLAGKLSGEEVLEVASQAVPRLRPVLASVARHLLD